MMSRLARIPVLGLLVMGLSGCGQWITQEAPGDPGNLIAGQFSTEVQQRQAVDSGLQGSAGQSALTVAEMAQLIEEGRGLLKDEDFVPALGRFGQVLAQVPNHPQAWSGVVDVHLAQNRLSEADWALANLEQIKPEAPPVKFRRARWHVLRSEPYAAQLLLEPYWEAHVQDRIRIEDVRFFQLLGLVYDRQGRHEQAERVYRAGLAVENNAGALRNNLAFCLILQGRYVYAAAFLEDLERNDMLTVRYAENLALAWVLAGRDDRAREVLERQKRSRIEINQSLTYYQWLTQRSDLDRGFILRGG